VKTEDVELKEEAPKEE
jgi:hypothetical protein